MIEVALRQTLYRSSWRPYEPVMVFKQVPPEVHTTLMLRETDFFDEVLIIPLRAGADGIITINLVRHVERFRCQMATYPFVVTPNPGQYRELVELAEKHKWPWTPFSCGIGFKQKSHAVLIKLML